LPRTQNSIPSTSICSWVDNETFLVSWDGLLTIVGDDGVIARTFPEARSEGNSTVLTPDKTFALYFGEKQLRALDLESGEVRPITDFSGRPGSPGGPGTTDGEQVWFPWYQTRGDLWMMDVESGQ